MQRLKGNSINPAAKVVITTIQRLYSMLKGDAEFDEANEEGSAFDSARPWQGEPPAVAYNAAIPPEFFDVVIVDECHRSIYELWAQVVLYFDAFLIGLTATPAGRTIGFFNKNLVMQYGHDQAVADGVNVDFDVYRVRTRVGEQGATIVGGADVYVDKRQKLTRAERLARLDRDLTYTADQLDRDVVADRKPFVQRDQLRQLDDWVFDLSREDIARKHGLGGGLDSLAIATQGFASHRRHHPTPHKGVLAFNGPVGMPFAERNSPLSSEELDFAVKHGFCVMPFGHLVEAGAQVRRGELSPVQLWERIQLSEGEFVL